MSFRQVHAAIVLAGSTFCSLESAAQELQGESPSESQDLTETIPPSSDDTVETIDPATPAATPPDLSSSPEDSPARVQLSGYARQSLELVYGELAYEQGTSSTTGSANTPTLWRDVFVSRTQLVLSASYLKNRRFEATISGVLGYTLHVAKEAPVFSVGVVDLTRGELEPELRDAYVAFFWPNVDLRIGQQRVAWGKSDFQSPNDVINARDLRDPFLAETELRYLPTTVVRSSISAGPVTFEGVVSPFFVPDRFDVYGSNWAAIQRHAPEKVQEFIGSASILVDATVERDLAQIWRQTERPPDNGRGLTAGARFSANLSGTDLSAYYHYGYDSTPYVKTTEAFADFLRNTNFTAADAQGKRSAVSGSEKFQPLLSEENAPATDYLSSHYIRRHHVGADLASTFGPIVLRVDAAYETRRVFYQIDDLNSFASPTVLAVFGLEYQTGSLDDTILVELLSQRLLHKPPLPLLAYEQTSAAVAGTLRWTLGGSWGIDLRGLVGIQPQTYVIQPALRFKPTDALTLRLGALIVSGPTNSFGWYYGDNDTAFLQLRYAF